MALQLTSTAFENGVDIPVKHTCDGENVYKALNGLTLGRAEYKGTYRRK